MKKIFTYKWTMILKATRKILIACYDSQSAGDLASFLRNNWERLFSEPKFCRANINKTSDCTGDYVEIDWYGTDETLNAVYNELGKYVVDPLHLSFDIDEGFYKINCSYRYSDVYYMQNSIAKVRENGKETSVNNILTTYYLAVMNQKYGYLDGHLTNDIRDVVKKVQINEKKKVVTIVWITGDVTIARCGEHDIWDPEKGILVCIAKHMFASGTQMNKWLKEQIPEQEPDYIPKHAKEDE